ncbi:MAG: glutathione S-transferase N-terminal domain-containing protein [Pirellula sp.]
MQSRPAHCSRDRSTNPVLTRSGPKLSDSRSICKYLERR